MLERAIKTRHRAILLFVPCSFGMFAHMNFVGRSCTNALNFLKSVAERGLAGLQLQRAYKASAILYDKG
jgi:hypothetical protein